MIQPPSPQTLASFGAQGEPVFLPAGEGRTYRVGDVILKYVNPQSQQYATWIADVLNQVQENNFRLTKPLVTVDGKWISDDSWSAWTLLEGAHSTAQDVPQVITAVQSFHEAIKLVPRPDFFAQIIDNEYGRADAAAWGEMPSAVMPDYRVPIEILYGLRIETMDVSEQLIHGDLNPQNILIAPDQPAGIIDLAPYFRPPEFALAIYAYWIGPWHGDLAVLENFSAIPHFKQMLIRAALRMLLIESEFKKTDLMERYLHATEIVRKFALL